MTLELNLENSFLKAFVVLTLFKSINNVGAFLCVQFQLVIESYDCH